MKERSKQSDLLKRHRKYQLFILAIFVTGWGFSTYKEIFAGLILGTIIGFYNHWLLYRKVNKFAETVVTGGKMYSLGTVSRMAAAVLAVIIAMRYPEYFNIYAVVLGLMTSNIVIFIEFILSNKTHDHMEER